LEALLTWGSPDPDTALRDRFLCLSDQGRNVAMACSLLDKPCGPSVLARLTDLPAAALGSAIEELLGSGIMTHSISAGELRLAFKGTADQEAVIRVAEPAHVGEWRRRVGGFFQEEGDAVAAAEHLLEAAWNHWNESQPVGTADRKSLTETVLEAGYRLEMTGSPVGATRLYQRLLDVEARYGEPLKADGAALLDQVRERLCVLLEHCGDYERALKVAAEMTSENEVGAAHLRVGRLSLLMGDLDRATSELIAARTEAAEASAPIQEGLALAELAEVELARGKHEQTSATIEHALKVCDRSSPQVLSRTQITLGKLHVERGDLDAAQRSFKQAVETARTNNIDGEEIRALINLGITHLRKGNTERATEHYQEALRACETDRDVRHKAFCLQNLAVLAHWQRNYKRALSLFHQAVRAFRQLGNKIHLAWLATDLGNLYLELGDSHRAESMAQLAGNLAPERDETSLGLFQTLLDGRLARERGHFLKAKHRFIKGLQMAQRMERPDEEANAAIELARLEWESGDHKAASELLDGIKTCPTAKIKARYLLIKGQVLSETSPKEGRTALIEASELFEQVADRDGMWKSRAALSVVAATMGRAAEGRRWKHLARDCEAQLRQDVPAEFHKSYLRASHRRPFMEELTLTTGEPQFRPDEASDADSERARPEPGDRVEVSAGGAADGWEQTRSRIVGEDSRLLKVLDAVRRIAPTDSTLLIQGESGTGKELVAEACHVLSARRDRPFVKVNCGALVETLLLSELFGHERGAFTGATRRKKGRFELAHGGTIFLDEIGDISPKTQVALLRVLQEKTFERVGGTQPIKVDVRILCATNKNLEAMVEAGTFREDLYYRLNTIQVELPPIRQRGNDVVLLANHILEGLARQEGEALKRLTAGAEQLLLKHPWAGNVRELENVLRSCWIFCDNSEISGELMGQFLMPVGTAEPPEAVDRPHVPESGRAEQRQTDPQVGWTPTEEGFGVIYNHIVEQNISLREFKKQMELQCIRQALSASNGNITRAATLLGMKRPRLSQLVKEHELAADAQGGNGNGKAMARKTKGE
jgi:DNA-binding NtrC family response regulator/tetratricopeptide (TPR) repeat protein